MFKKSIAKRGTASAAVADPPPWRVLIVDDEPLVHAMTRLALSEERFEGRGIEFVSSESAKAAANILAADTSFAVAFIDVIMESDNAGLWLVSHIRNELCNSLLRIVLRTGQPGLMPESIAMSKYDINAYLNKADTDSPRLRSTLLMALHSYREIANLLESNKKLAELVSIDPLTGLHTPRELHTTLKRAIGGAQRRGETLAVVFLDIDNFKHINDTEGHLHGDEILSTVGKIIGEISRQEDICFRYGGDEFLCILPNCNGEQVREIFSKRLNERLAQIGVSCSIGVATSAGESVTDDELIRRADEDMYLNKKSRH